ncbi:copper oxidase [Archangium sp.]|uniref:copper oxidase n=1 Tax=Archangium sp. TaxID=1872627 RepID=UPI002D69A446|nr:copper oxidase [Archangium sp.]HYO59955.1 copper oxidase [Archangium sp.]
MSHSRRRKSLHAVLLSACVLAAGCDPQQAPASPDEQDQAAPVDETRSGLAASCARTLTADVVALDQVITYNRFGSFNPVGMLYALKRDVVAVDPTYPPGPGNARLRDGKRPRPLTLRVNVGDCLQVRFTNWLAPTRAQIPLAGVPEWAENLPPEEPEPGEEPGSGDMRDDAPATRLASFHINGLQPLDLVSDGSNVGLNVSSLAMPGETRIYKWFADHEGAFFAHSLGAPVGGEGMGGSTTHGLFGAVNVEPAGSVWYRSQVTAEQLAAAQRKDPLTGQPLTNPDGTPLIDYDAVDAAGLPLLRMTTAAGEIVHGDLNAIISGFSGKATSSSASLAEGRFREFTVLFHDEMKAVQAFQELETRPMLHGVRDGFGINYGASGLGSELLANRKKIGPTKNCAECKFEEFFLESWANGDPALNVDRDAEGRAVAALYPDDPSNVHHSYLGDPVRIRNIHAGPKETHVFHLHGHQWLHTPFDDNSTYLDSQTIGPGGTFTYDISYGGAGNRNLTVGDAIFHCHLYPHFAQGMWALWRAHDVFEAGTQDRRLPDGEIAGGTPNPAVVPVPGRAMPPMPTYAPTEVVLSSGGTAVRPAVPGYPFFVAAIPGHRPPQPPLDLEHNGGLPRHVMTGVPATTQAVEYGRRGEFDVEVHQAHLKLLPEDGTPGEKVAMQYHAGQLPGASRINTRQGWPAAGYPAYTPEGQSGWFLVNGQPPKPGAPFSEPCKPGAPERNYRAAYVQTDLKVNRAGWHDPQGRIMVLERDVQATLDGTRSPEPFFFRANSGDCVNFTATNLIPDVLQADDFQIFTPTDTIGQHIHLVKFDVTASDGSGNGWNYEDGTFSADDVRARIDAANAAGGAFAADGTLTETGSRVFLSATSHPRIPGAPPGAQSTRQRWWADPLVNSTGKDRTLRTVFTHDHFTPSSAQHHGFYGALVVEPAGSSWRNPVTGTLFGTRDDGGPTSFKADILTTNTKDSYREFNLAFADYAIVYDASGTPVNPPTLHEVALPRAVEHPAGVVAPEVLSTADPGTMLINYRHEPLPLRIAARGPDGQWTPRTGALGDMANVFRSDLHGDPYTPLLPVYEGDRVQIRLVQGAQEDQHVFTLNGLKWLHEPDRQDSGFVNGQAIGISEHMEFALEVPGNKNLAGAADYLYQGASTDDLWNGMWGILRSYGQSRPDLKPLPNNSTLLDLNKVVPACPLAAPKRQYTVHAITARNNLPGGRLVYNPKHGLYDPDAILFVKAEHLAAVRSGARRPEPLVLRAAAGECVEVKLVNELPAQLSRSPHWNYYTPITEGFNVNQVPMSSHVSLHPQLLQYDVNSGDGANVGYNSVQTVAPGQSRTYQWYAGRYEVLKLPAGTNLLDFVIQTLLALADFILSDQGGNLLLFDGKPMEMGAVNLRDMADVVTHGMHGAVGTLIVEPQGATWSTDPGTDVQATVSYRTPNGTAASFREFVLIYQDELALHSDQPVFQSGDPSLNAGTALRNMSGADDAEDVGHKGFNYRTEPLWARLGLPPHVSEGTVNDQQIGDIFSSAVHGDPATPVFTAKAGTPVRFRVVQPSGHARQHAFTLHGAEWMHDAWADGSRSEFLGSNTKSCVLGTQDGMSVMKAWNFMPLYGAGGMYAVPGDYMYRDQPASMLSDGLWGIVRVQP